ncbi:unnamed protein product [Euphydryas editha]|uniref:Uncharacterized protein n=1 Tax=Euphydryas editha TaxID=104508 RepID=A0AAU9TE03_EUPED|nr:unnamed protein product [Euphydryas editha]
MEYFEAKDYIMHDSRKEDFAWESSVRLTLVESNEELGMFLEEREGRKRKWQGEGKMMRREEGEEREQRKVPPKKIMVGENKSERTTKELLVNRQTDM